MDAAKVLNDTIAATGFQANAPESQASDTQVDESGGIMKCFDLGDVFWKAMDGAKRRNWVAAVGGDETAAQQQWMSQAMGGTLPTAPVGKQSDPQWRGETLASLYTRSLTGFVGQGKDAASVSSKADAIRKFQLNPGLYPSPKMIVVAAGANDVKRQTAAGSLKLGKPSIFCHLEFEEFLYDPGDQQYGQTANPNDPNAHSGVKEMSCVGAGAEIWQSSRVI
jgi:hypothetical protein